MKRLPQASVVGLVGNLSRQGWFCPAVRQPLIEQVKSLKPGLTQIVCRPAVESRGLQLLSNEWQQRVWDADILADEQVKQVMQDEAITVTNWREIMMRFEQGQAIDSGAGVEEQGAE